MQKLITLTRIQDLAEVYNAVNYPTYRTTVRMLNVSKELKSTLIRKTDELRFIKSVERQREEFEIVEQQLLRWNEEIKKAEVSRMQANHKLECAKQALRVAQLMMKEAQEEYRKQQEMKCKAEQERSDWEKLITIQRKKLERMKQYTLVHPTATITALDKKRESVIVCTKYDATKMNFKKFADCILDTSEDEFAVDELIPQDASERFSSKEEFLSAIHYVRMVVQYYMQDKPYQLLYNSSGIRYL